MTAMPSMADLARAKENLDAYDDVVNGDSSAIVETPGGQMVNSVARAMAALSAYVDRGLWTINTLYAVKDVVRDPANTGRAFVRLTAGMSPGTTFATEYAAGAGPWRIFQLGSILGLDPAADAIARQELGFPATLGGDHTQLHRLAAGADGWVSAQPGMDTPINMSLAITRDVSNNLNIVLMGQDMANPSLTNPVLMSFRTSSGGDYVRRAVTAALSLQLPSGSPLGVAAGEVMRCYVLAVDSGAGVVLAAINCRKSGAGNDATSIKSLGLHSLITTVAVGVGALLSRTFYSTAVQANKAARVLGYFEYAANPLAGAGVFTANPDDIVLYTPGMKMPGDEVHHTFNWTGAVGTTVTHPPEDNSALQFGEVGNLGIDLTHPVRSPCNVLRLQALLNASCLAASSVVLAVHKGGAGGAVAVGEADTSATNGMTQVALDHEIQAPVAGDTVYNLGAGAVAATTLTINGSNGGGLFAGKDVTSFRITEYQG